MFECLFSLGRISEARISEVGIERRFKLDYEACTVAVTAVVGSSLVNFK